MSKINSQLKKWLPTPLLIISAILHIFALLFILLLPQYWLWVVATIVCDHLWIIALGLLPRSQLLGANWTHLPITAAQRGEIALTIDDGPDLDVTVQVLAILDRYAVTATFF